MAKYLMHPDASSSGADASERALRSLVNALNEGRLSEAVNQFDDHFSFTDHALDFEFIDKTRLMEFFQTLREFFPDTALEIESTVACGDHLTAEWKLSGTDIQLVWNQTLRFPIVVQGASTVCIENGRITRYSQYYDKMTSGRNRLTGMFKERVEY
jgi:hypothetical protein